MYHRVNSMVRRQGVALPELVVAIGVAVILISLAIPVLTRYRASREAEQSLANAGAMARAVSAYSADFADLPPTWGDPGEPRAGWHFDFGSRGSGNWFEHRFLYSIAVAPYLASLDEAAAPGRPGGARRAYFHQGRVAIDSDYLLTDTLYATPEFFAWETQSGQKQFASQKLTSIVHPSDKGIVYQDRVYHFPEYGAFPGCCAVDLPAPVIFADLSGEQVVIRRMKPGIINVFGGGAFPTRTDPASMEGQPIANTVRGVAGLDR